VYAVEYLSLEPKTQFFATEEEAGRFLLTLKPGARMRLIEMAEMADRDKIERREERCLIEIQDANHFLRTIKFVRENNLVTEFGRPMVDLLSLLVSTRDRDLLPTELPPDDRLVNSRYDREKGPVRSLAPMARVYPDGYKDPAFGWSGSGMVGGFIFHRHCRQWQIHT